MGIVFRELDDPPRRSDVNNGSGVTQLALCLANWATRLAGAGGRRRSDEQGRLGSGQKVIWSPLNLEDSKENVKAEGRGEEADRSSDPARRSDANSRSCGTTLALSLANWATRLPKVT